MLGDVLRLWRHPEIDGWFIHRFEFLFFRAETKWNVGVNVGVSGVLTGN